MTQIEFEQFCQQHNLSPAIARSFACRARTLHCAAIDSDQQFDAATALIEAGQAYLAIAAVRRGERQFDHDGRSGQFVASSAGQAKSRLAAHGERLGASVESAWSYSQDGWDQRVILVLNP